MKKYLILVFCFAMASNFIIQAAAFAQDKSTQAVEIKAGAPESLEVSVSNGTELKIIDLQAKMESGECVITWKTNIMPSAKAKFVFWSGSQPNLLDKSFIEKEPLKGFLHKFAIKASEVPEDFVKIRLSYVISEEAGAYSDLSAADITGLKKNNGK